MDDEHFLALVAVQRIGATRRLAGTADVEAMRLADMHVLMRVLRNTGTDDGEIFLLVAAGAARIDERIGAGPQFVIPNQSRLQLRGQ